jgi:arylsulfatase A-like enzyme
VGVGLRTFGLPRSPIGMQKEDPKALGFATGQFDKNHLGDLDEHLPTAYGFDEFCRILHHLNAGEYVEQYDFPTDLAKSGCFKQRGIVLSWGLPDGTQKIEDTGAFGTGTEN